MEGYELFAGMISLVLMTVAVGLIPYLAQALVPKPPDTPKKPALRKDAKGRYTLFDALKGIAIIAVIVIHVTFLWPDDAVFTELPILDALDTAMRFAIPLFFIASGALLTPPQRTPRALKRFYGQKLVRLAIPYLLVTAVLALTMNLGMAQFVQGFFAGSLSTPYYFIIVLFQMYLLYPFIAELAQKRWFVYATLVFSILNLFSFQWHLFEIPLVFRFLFFFVWGIYMRTQLLERGMSRTLLPWLSIIGIFWAIFTIIPGSYFNIRLYYGTAMFVLLYLLFTSGYVQKRIENGLAWVGKLSLWIFLLHLPIMEWFFPHLFATIHLPGPLMLVIMTLISIVVSIVSAYIVAKLYTAAGRSIATLTRT